MKKAFDQTVRDLKRGVNKKVLKVPGVEQKVLDATSNEPWGPHGSLLAELAQATQNYHEYQMIMSVMWKRINDTGKNWRHVYKALTVLEYLVGHGSERVIEEIREHAYQISTLSNFQYVDSGGRDQGSNVRRKSQSLVALVNDKERIQEVRQKASANKDKYRSSALPGGAYRHSSYSGAGGHADRYDDDRYGYKDDDRNGQGRERDYGYRDADRYGRGGDSYSRDGDRYDRDNDDRYGRDGYRDDDYRGRASEDYQPGSRRSVDRYTDHSLDDDDRHSSRSAGGKYADPSQGERRLERQLSEPNAAPPSYEEATRDAQSPAQNERDRASATSPAHKSSSSSPPKAASPSTSVSQVPENGVPAKPERVPNKELNAFDEFDPRVSLSAAPPVPSSAEFDFFGDLSASDSSNSLALALVTSATTTTGADMAISSGFGVDVPAPSTTVSSEPYENPFGDSPFKATLDEDFNAQPQNIAPVSSFQSSGSISSAEPFPPVASEVETVPDFGFGDTFVGLTYNPSTGNGQQSSSNPSFSAQGVLPTSTDVLDEIFPQMGPSAHISFQTSLPATTQNMQTTQMNYLPQAGLPTAVPQLTTSVSFESVQSSDPNNMQSGHLNLQGLPGSVSWPSQTAPDFSQAAQLSAPNGMHSAHVGVPQPGIQAAAQPTPYNMHPGHLNALQPGLSASISLPSPAVSMYSHGAQPAPPSSMQSAHLNFQQQPGVPVPLTLQTAPGSAGLPAKTQPTKFEPKSAVWSDTLSRGLVDLNISGSKINPLADIGIDFDSINRKEKRKEMKSSAAPVASTISMGKAMGSGSGMSRASAGGLVQPPNPMMGGGVGMGMVGGMGMGGGMAMGGYGGGMNQSPMGMGMGMNMGMGMGIGQGAQMRPPTGMLPPGSHTSSAGYNPMMGMGNYGPQQPYGGGQQQPYGGGYR